MPQFNVIFQILMKVLTPAQMQNKITAGQTGINVQVIQEKLFYLCLWGLPFSQCVMVHCFNIYKTSLNRFT
jgi:hypothetical protein